MPPLSFYYTNQDNCFLAPTTPRRAIARLQIALRGIEIRVRPTPFHPKNPAYPLNTVAIRIVWVLPPFLQTLRTVYIWLSSKENSTDLTPPTIPLKHFSRIIPNFFSLFAFISMKNILFVSEIFVWSTQMSSGAHENWEEGNTTNTQFTDPSCKRRYCYLLQAI